MLEAPVLLHLEHEQRWGFDEHDTRVALLWDLLVAHSKKRLVGRNFSRHACFAVPTHRINHAKLGKSQTASFRGSIFNRKLFVFRMKVCRETSWAGS